MATERGIPVPPDDAEASPQPEGVSEKEINGVTYRTRLLPFSTGLPLLKRLIDVVAPVIAAGLRGGRQYAAANILDVLPTAFSEKDIDRFADAFGKVSQYLNEEGQWVTLVKNPKIDNREKHFTGRYLEFMQWLFFCCEANFSSFFGGAAKGGKEGEEEAETVLDRLLRMVGAKEEKAKSSASDSGTTSSTE